MNKLIRDNWLLALLAGLIGVLVYVVLKLRVIAYIMRAVLGTAAALLVFFFGATTQSKTS
jgi:energy-converting hydrogenase Eha subunit G